MRTVWCIKRSNEAVVAAVRTEDGEQQQVDTLQNSKMCLYGCRANSAQVFGVVRVVSSQYYFVEGDISLSSV
jgi:hypothetical protein